MAKEEWRDVVGWEGLYRVSSFGRVRSRSRYVRHWLGGKQLKRRKILKPWKFYRSKRGENVGALGVSLSRENKICNVPIHRLVLMAFVGPCPEGMECCHKDGNPENNRLDNLRWGTKSSNTKDSIRHGTFRGKENIRGVNRWTGEGCKRRKLQ